MTTIENKKASFFSNLTFQILIAMIAGALLGIFVHNNYTEEIKVAFLLESPLIDKQSYINISNPEIYNKFDMVLTFDRNLIKINPDKFKYYPFGGYMKKIKIFIIK